MAYKKKISFLKAKITDFRRKHSDWPEDPQAETNLLYKKSDEIRKEYKSLELELEKTLKKGEEKRAAQLKEQIIVVLKDQDKIISQIELAQKFQENIEVQDYMGHIHAIKKLQAELDQLKEAEVETNKSKLIAEKEQKTPFGKVALPLDHFAVISKLSDYQKDFATRYKLTCHETADRLAFISEDKKESIEVTRECITANFNPENKSSKLTEAMVELYLKSIEGKEIFIHKIQSENSDLREKIEMELAVKLQKAGNEEANINGKKVVDILESSGVAPKN